MTPVQLADAVLAAVRRGIAAGELATDVPSSVLVERPKNREHGDYATNVALLLAKPARRPPREIAAVLSGYLAGTDGVDRVEVAGPGFLNVTLTDLARGEVARTVVTAGAAYGRGTSGAGQRVNLEFVSANPTGPLTLPSGRWAAVGDSLARLWEATGGDVTREYYFNDAGRQIELFAQSLYARAAQADGRAVEMPADGYQGEYVADVAARVLAAHPGLLDEAAEKAVEVFRREGVELILAAIKSQLTDFRVAFDMWFLERSLHDTGAVDAAIDRLRGMGRVYEADGAVWLRTTDFGDDKDRVLVRSDGSPTYVTADAAYYLDKRERGFGKVVMLLGADHHGYIGRMRALAACFGDDPEETLEIVIGQMVHLVRGGEPVKMSKRAGAFVTLEDLVEEVGVDAARYSLARSSVDATLDLDLDLISRQDADNPVFYVQYAHARIASLLRHADDLGVSPGHLATADLGLLATEREAELLLALADFPRVVASAAELRGPHRVSRYLEDLAGTYHRFYDTCRVLPQGDDEATELTRSRLWLCTATRVVLANGLALLGVSAPDRM